MSAWCMKFIRDLLTADAKSQTYDLIRTITAGSALSAIAYTGWHVFKTGTFDISAFGMGMAAIIGAGGAAAWARKDVE